MSDADARERQLRELFDEAVALPPAAREPLLAGIADDLLAERLRALLRQDELGTVAALQNTPAAALDRLRRIGNYELLRELGRGGMGTVLLARQVEPVERLVALKLIADGHSDHAAVERFEQERQTLATLNHPGIAQLYEAGTGDDGTLFFAMEYVRGEPITAYCNRRGLPLRSRIRLFGKVCDAVQHAHQRAVVHRDLKPGNILVTEADGPAIAKVIDFGVARALSRAPGRLSPDDAGRVLGTWQYMSPEQMAPERLDTDTRSDVYSLGVVLYELLVGARPFVCGDDADERERLMRRMQETDAPLASSRCEGLPAELRSAVAAERGTTPARLARDLREDLDAILARALARDRNDRYASAQALREDLENHLQRLPVRAVGDGAWYRTRRFVQRNRALTAAILTVVLGIAAGTAGAIYGMLGTSRALQAERTKAAGEQLQLRRRSAVLDFFELVVFHADPGTGAPPPSLREVLDTLTPGIEARYAGLTLEEAAIRAAVGRVYLGTGEPRKAEVQLRRAWELTRTMPLREPTEDLLLLADLARVTFKLRGPEAARGHYRQLLDVGVAALQPSAPALAGELRRLGDLTGDPGRHAEFLERLDALLREAAPAASDARLTNTLLAVFGLVLQDNDDPAGAEVLTRLENATRVALTDQVDLQFALGRQAEILLRRGACAAALRLASEVAASVRMPQTGAHWLQLQMARVAGLAQCLSGEEAAGETALLDLHRRLWPLDARANEQTVAAANGLAELCTKLERDGQLEAFLVRSLQRWRTAAAAAPRREPWWPSCVEGLPTSAVATSLRIVAAVPATERSGPVDAVLGALLLASDRTSQALESLALAQQQIVPPTPELLADVVRAQKRIGQQAAAETADAALRGLAAGPDVGAERLDRARRRAAADLGH